MIGALRRDDRGASLVLMLVIITVVSVVVTALVSFAFTSSRTAVQAREQRAATYAADGAAQIAINALRRDEFNGAAGHCVTGASSMLLPDFYPGANGAAPSTAYVSCTPGPANGSSGGATSANASPGSAVLTLGTGAGGEDGITVTSNAGPIKVRGGVFSNSSINVTAGGIDNTYNRGVPYNLARGSCINQQLITPAAYTTCNYSAADARGEDPGTLTPHGASYDPPPVAPADGTIGACTGGATYQALTPGRYTSAAALTALTGCSTAIVHFTPGTYYFDFKDAGSHVWTVDRTYVIGGTPTIPLTTTPTVAQMPTACVSPADALATTTSGVRFVFGGDSRLVLTHQGSPGGQITICASKSASGPPIAIYGLKVALGGAFPVSAPSGCVTTVSPATSRCALIYTGQSPNTTLTIQGTTYTPMALITINMNNSTNQVFRWGLVTRALLIGTTGSANVGLPLIDVPDVAASPIPEPNIMYLAVYLCRGAATCTGSGTPRLRVKVQVSATAPRSATVLSWSATA